MSDLDEIVLFCEDAARGPTVRLLEVALQDLKGKFPLAALVNLWPAGDKGQVDARVRHGRSAARTPQLVFGIRDRDFLAWPLSRYCIESYLIDPPFLVSALGGDEDRWRSLLCEHATARLWLDLARGTIEDARWRLRRANTDLPKVIATRDEALAEVDKSAAELMAKGKNELSPEKLREKFAALAMDVENDGPTAHRVDGKALLGDLGSRLANEGKEPPGGLKPALLGYAERTTAPLALIEDLRLFLQGVGAALPRAQ